MARALSHGKLSRAGASRWLPVAAVLLLFVATGVTAKPPSAPPLPPLTTVPNSPRLPGKFVWADLVTDDVPAARKFYSELLGWKFQDVGDYTICANDGRPLCGMFQRTRPAGGKAKPRWFGYISVASVSRAEKAVTAAGGKVLAAPRKMPQRGEQAVFADAEGAVFGVVKSSGGDPEDFMADPGDWIWIQLLSRNADKAAQFYKTVAGYEIVENTLTNSLSDYVLVSEGYARATVRTIRHPKDQVEPTWLPFVRVKNVAESVAKAKELGGKVLVKPKAELLNGKAAVVEDPTGAAIGLLEWSDDMLKGAR